MISKFSGDLFELKEKLSPLNEVGEWIEVNANQQQFRHNSGGMMNFYPTTGSVNFQGKPAGKEQLAKLVTALLEEGKLPAVEETTPLISSLGAADNVTPETSISAESKQILRYFSDSELVIGLVGPVGADMSEVVAVLTDRLKIVGYNVTEIRVSRDVIPQLVAVDGSLANEAERINGLMDAGNIARKNSGDDAILALGVAATISKKRPAPGKPLERHAFIVNSLKHPEEVLRLRQIYPMGFYLFGVYPDESVRLGFLKRKGISDTEIAKLIERDRDEHLPFGQRVNDTFHLSDFFVRLGNQRLELENSLLRLFDILFGDPYKTPTFDEYAMFLAFSSSLRSADLSRQVGAVVTKTDEVLATGANDCPKFGGGVYWPELNSDSHKIEDKPDGRDYKRGEDSNKVEQRKIIDAVVQKAAELNLDTEKVQVLLEQSRIKDITEYGRVVHAEMDALLSCARNNISTKQATLFCTTFPCHNCAKHIVAAGISRVVFIEPYQKSKAAEFHTDSISVGFQPVKSTVHFEPFVGVGPRRFLDLFSIRLGAGYELKRKDRDGQVMPWELSSTSKLRVQMLPGSYIELENEAKLEFEKYNKG